jgi:hypothetical protein
MSGFPELPSVENVELVYCGAGAEEPKSNCLLEPEPKLRAAATAPFYLSQT